LNRNGDIAIVERYSSE